MSYGNFSMSKVLLLKVCTEILRHFLVDIATDQIFVRFFSSFYRFEFRPILQNLGFCLPLGLDLF